MSTLDDLLGFPGMLLFEILEKKRWKFALILLMG